jgi:hypothetical protein
VNRFSLRREMRDGSFPKCPACLHPILPGDVTEPCFTLEHGETRVHWDCAHGDDDMTPEQVDQKGAADDADVSGYYADKGIQGARW